jgi:hypothetical protein
MNANVDKGGSVVVYGNDGVHAGDHCSNDAALREQNQTSSQGSIARLLVHGRTPRPRSSPPRMKSIGIAASPLPNCINWVIYN